MSQHEDSMIKIGKYFDYFLNQQPRFYGSVKINFQNGVPGKFVNIEGTDSMSKDSTECTIDSGIDTDDKGCEST